MGRGDKVLEMILLAVTAVILAPIVEEMLFSGLLANRVTKHLGATTALLVTPFAFMAGHVFNRVAFDKDFIMLYFVELILRFGFILGV